jgi:hypothetical protein
MYKYNKQTCAVAACHAPYPDGVSFHRFPKAPELRKRWILECRRKDRVNPDTARICSKHFKSESIWIDGSGVCHL